MALIATRLSMLLFLSPLDLFGKLPGNIKVFLLLGLAACFSWGLDIHPAVPKQLITLSLMLARELLIGLTFAFALYAVFAAFALAGRLIDFQAGYSAAGLFNPASAEQDGLLSTLYVYLGIAVFFAMGGTGLLLKTLEYSFIQLPVGDITYAVEIGHIMKLFGLVFTAGVMIASPIITVLLLVDALIGLASKSMPQMNVYFLFLPLKAGVALGVMVVVLPLMRSVFEHHVNDAFSALAQWLM